jgi:hypothetical protein
MTPFPPSPGEPDLRPGPAAADARMLEYTALREEVVKRIEGRQQLLSTTLTLAGAFLGVGWTVGAAVGLFILPPLALLLAGAWSQNEIRLHLIQRYMTGTLEPGLPGAGWGAFSRRETAYTRLLGQPVETMAIGGLFLAAQVFAIVLGLFHFQVTSLVEWVMLAVSLFSLFAMLALVGVVNQSAKTA